MSSPKKSLEVQYPYECRKSSGCPHKTVAYSVQEVQDKFGWRTMKDGTQRPQDYCRRCNNDRGH